MQRLEAGAKAQETTVRILVFVNPRPPHWPDLPHEGLEESCWGPAQALRVPQLTQNFPLHAAGTGGWKEELHLQRRGLGHRCFFSGVLFIF